MARRLSDILRRFRPAVVPGPAGPAGVPVDRVAQAEAELAAVFAALEPAMGEAARARERGRADAERRRKESIEEADRIVAAARARVDAERARAASMQLAAIDADRARLTAEADAEAERIRQTAAARLPGLVEEIVAAVWATAGVLPRGSAAPGHEELTG